jgi:hypothetical protein
MPVYEQTTNGTRYLAIRLTLTEQSLTADDIANNRSRIAWTFELYETHDYGSWYDYNDLYAHLDLNGVRIGRWLVKNDFRPSGANSKTIASGTYVCYHNDDGSKSMAFNAVYNSPNVSSNQGVATISGSLALTQINRARIYVGNGSNVPVKGDVYVGNSSNVPVKAKGVYVGSGSNLPWRAK